MHSRWHSRWAGATRDPLTCISLLAMKPLPSASQVWKNSCAFLSMVSCASASSWVPSHGRSSREPRKSPLPWCPQPGPRGLETTLLSRVAIQICQFLRVFSEPEGGRRERGVGVVGMQEGWKRMRGDGREAEDRSPVPVSLFISTSSEQGEVCPDH